MTTGRAGALPGGKRFTEGDVREFHDQSDHQYRLFWDPEGRDHWGIFASLDDGPDEWLAACRRTDEHMKAAAGPRPGDRILDVCCGNGVTANSLAADGCDVTAIDLSPVKIAAARRTASACGLTTRFHEGSATALPVATGYFDLAYSQAALYGVSDRPAALREIRRALREGGRFVLDDMVTPVPPAAVSAESVHWVYDRLRFSPTWSAVEYRDQLAAAGLEVTMAADLTRHLRRSYEVLGLLAARTEGVDPGLQDAYAQMVRAIDRGELGWSFFVASAGNPA